MNGQSSHSKDFSLTSLLDKISVYCNEFGEQNEKSLDTFAKLRGLTLIAESYDCAYQIYANSEKELALYFGENTLRHCLERVTQLEVLQSDIKKHLSINHAKNVNASLDSFVNFYQIDHLPCPISLQNSPLWIADDDSRKGKYKTIFRKAHENLEEPDKMADLSDDPNDDRYNQFIKANFLESHLAYKAKNIAVRNSNILTTINQLQDISDKVSCNDIFEDLSRCIEIIRQIYMSFAQDIYFIRTGEYVNVASETEQISLEQRYTELPLHDYFEDRTCVRELIEEEELVTELDQWRAAKQYTNRQLLKKEYLDFLVEKQSQVLMSMRNEYPNLWYLREHSGTLDEDVTPLNFARMFYGRKDVDHQFLELQWKYELLTELIAKTALQKAKEPIPFTPEQTAVKLFVEKLNTLAELLYENWDGKKVSIGAHMHVAQISIKKLELASYLQDMQDNHFEDLQKWCYPQTANSRQIYVKYVTVLRDKGFFGELPNNQIALQLAPIVGLAEGTVTNYLSQK